MSTIYQVMMEIYRPEKKKYVNGKGKPTWGLKKKEEHVHLRIKKKEKQEKFFGKTPLMELLLYISFFCRSFTFS